MGCGNDWARAMTVLLSDYLHDYRPASDRAVHHHIVLRELIERNVVPAERLIDQIWGRDEDGGPLDARKRVMKLVYHLRAELKDEWWIRCLGHSGYQLVRTCDV